MTRWGLIFVVLLLIIMVGFAGTLGWFAGMAWSRHPLLAATFTGMAVVYILWLHTAVTPPLMGWAAALLCSATAFATAIQGSRDPVPQRSVTSQ